MWWWWRRTDFRTNKPSDVISTLVSIYDSKDLFVRELQVLLAQRLLAITSSDLNPLTETWDDPFTAPTSPEVGPTSPPPEKASGR